MIVKTAFVYAGIEYKPGDDFDINLLDIEDRNDIFLRRIGLDAEKVKAPAVHKLTKKESK